MLLLSRTKTLTVAEGRKKSKSVKRCSSCKRSSSARRSKTPEPTSQHQHRHSEKIKSSTKNSLIQPTIPPNHPTAPPQSIRKPDNLDDLNFPVPPTTFPGGPKSGGGGGPAGPPGGGSGGSGGGGDLDFDDLAKRFDALKKRNN